jgi:hypothetical protein
MSVQSISQEGRYTSTSLRREGRDEYMIFVDDDVDSKVQVHGMRLKPEFCHRHVAQRSSTAGSRSNCLSLSIEAEQYSDCSVLSHKESGGRDNEVFRLRVLSAGKKCG